ncbi:hypothetical protein GQ600_26418 [Phytophthora cactorum]|nr:hypothetical protein GQ600_26418 [Phytophthora cactorum]
MTPEVAANVFKELPRLAKAVMAATGAEALTSFRTTHDQQGDGEAMQAKIQTKL